MAQTVSTDKADYLPDETVTITGADFTPGETVTILIEHLNYPTHETEVLYATVGGDGSFVNKEYVILSTDFGELYRLIAKDESGLWAVTNFSDGINLSNPTVLTKCAGEVAVFSASTNNKEGTSVIVNWQVSTNGSSTATGGNWTDLANDAIYSGIGTGSLSIVTNTSLNGYFYRVRGTVGSGTAYTEPGTLNVNSAPAIFNVGYDVATLCGGQFVLTLDGSEVDVTYYMYENNENSLVATLISTFGRSA